MKDWSWKLTITLVSSVMSSCENDSSHKRDKIESGGDEPNPRVEIQETVGVDKAPLEDLAELLSQRDSPQREERLVALLAQWALTDSGAAAESFKYLGLPIEIGERIARDLMKQSVESAMIFADKGIKGARRPKLMAEMAVFAARKDPELGFTYFERIPFGTRRGLALGSFIETSYKSAPEKTKEWVFSLSDAHEREMAITQLASNVRESSVEGAQNLFLSTDDSQLRFELVNADALKVMESAGTAQEAVDRVAATFSLEGNDKLLSVVAESMVSRFAEQDPKGTAEFLVANELLDHASVRDLEEIATGWFSEGGNADAAMWALAADQVLGKGVAFDAILSGLTAREMDEMVEWSEVIGNQELKDRALSAIEKHLELVD